VAGRRRRARLRERYETFWRRDLYEVQVAALFLDAVFLSVHPDGPKEVASQCPGEIARA
jgi:hypothetical protein